MSELILMFTLLAVSPSQDVSGKFSKKNNEISHSQLFLFVRINLHKCFFNAADPCNQLQFDWCLPNSHQTPCSFANVSLVVISLSVKIQFYI